MTVDLERLREGWDFEAKLAAGRDGQGALPDSFWETYAAMANTDGGTIVIGAAERPDGSFEVRGLPDAARVEQDLWNALDNRQKVSVNLLTREDVQRSAAEGGDVIVVTVPRARRSDRPVYLKGNPLNAYRRFGDGDRRCSELETRRMLADASDEPADSQVLEGYGVQDLDRDTVDTWRNLFRSRQPDHPFLLGDEVALLSNLGGWRRDRVSGLEGLTVAGLLMFGRERAILDRFPWYQLDYREMDEGLPGERWQDRVTIDGTWPGNVFAFFRRVFPKLSADLKVPFRLDTDLRRIDVTPAHEALREALVNALIHADYTGTRGIRIFKRRTSFELINPGTLRVSWAEARAGNASDPRNPSLQKMFQLLGFGDRAGSGVPRILQAWREQHWRVPEVTEDFETLETRLVLSTESLLPADVIQALEQRFGDRFRALSEPKRTALVAAAAEQRISNRRLQQVSDLHPRDITFLLGDLVKDGFLVPHGERSGRSYTLPHFDDERTLGSGGITRGLRQHAANSDRSQVDFDKSSVGFDQSSANMALAPDDEHDVVEEIRLSSWAAAPKVQAAILALCRERPHTLPELVVALGRKPVSVRRYLRYLVTSGALMHTHPDRPTHPHQAYRAAPTPREPS